MSGSDEGSVLVISSQENGDQGEIGWRLGHEVVGGGRGEGELVG